MKVSWFKLNPSTQTVIFLFLVLIRNLTNWLAENAVIPMYSLYAVLLHGFHTFSFICVILWPQALPQFSVVSRWASSTTQPKPSMSSRGWIRTLSTGKAREVPVWAFSRWSWLGENPSKWGGEYRLYLLVGSEGKRRIFLDDILFWKLKIIRCFRMMNQLLRCYIFLLDLFPPEIFYFIESDHSKFSVPGA